MSIQRYVLDSEFIPYEDHPSPVMTPLSNGDYVLYADHAAEVERLTAKIAGLEARVRGYQDAMRAKDPIQAANCRVVEYHQCKAERDTAVARAERAEEALREVLATPSFGALHTADAVDTIKLARSVLASAQDAKPAYRALEPEPWGGPEREDA